MRNGTAVHFDSLDKIRNKNETIVAMQMAPDIS